MMNLIVKRHIQTEWKKQDVWASKELRIKQ